MSDTAAAELLALARERGVRIAVAESLTGGLLADAFVRVPGASTSFVGAVVAYDTSLKSSLLGVDEDVLREVGPVHERVAEAMAVGVRARCATVVNGVLLPAEVGISTTGVAGPAPDPQTGQSAGTVWIGLSVGAQVSAQRVQLVGDRQAIRAGAMRAALSYALLNLSQHDAGF